jgi:hypothetical protein
MEIKELYTLINRYDKALKNYVVEHDQVNRSYHVAKLLLNELLEKSHENARLRNSFGEWLGHGDTLRLIDLLGNTKYDFSNLVHSNAMDLMDTIQCVLKTTEERK